MNTIKLDTILKSIFSEILEHSNFELKDSTTAEDVDGWSSSTHMMIITEIENKLNIKFKLFDLMNMNNIGDLKTSINKELSN